MSRLYPKYNSSVFINCPFDNHYKPLFHALVFAVQSCGFIPRCAKEYTGTEEIRIHQIIEIMRVCLLGIHDLSRTESNENGLPRFNMPLELGLFMGARHFGEGQQAQKKYLVLDKEDFRFKTFISDFGGQDIRTHSDSPEKMISSVRDWLSQRVPRRNLPHGSHIFSRYRNFQNVLPEMCANLKWTVDELQFTEFTLLSSNWLNLQK